MQGVYVHGEVQLAADDLLVFTSELVGTVDALCVPVSPVQAVLKDGDGEGVGQPYNKPKDTQRWGVKVLGSCYTRSVIHWVSVN